MSFPVETLYEERITNSDCFMVALDAKGETSLYTLLLMEEQTIMLFRRQIFPQLMFTFWIMCSIWMS